MAKWNFVAMGQAGLTGWTRVAARPVARAVARRTGRPEAEILAVIGAAFLAITVIDFLRKVDAVIAAGRTGRQPAGDARPGPRTGTGGAGAVSGCGIAPSRQDARGADERVGVTGPMSASQIVAGPCSYCRAGRGLPDHRGEFPDPGDHLAAAGRVRRGRPDHGGQSGQDLRGGVLADGEPGGRDHLVRRRARSGHRRDSRATAAASCAACAAGAYR